jgi:hypothetical protein
VYFCRHFLFNPLLLLHMLRKRLFATLFYHTLAVLAKPFGQTTVFTFPFFHTYMGKIEMKCRCHENRVRRIQLAVDKLIYAQDDIVADIELVHVVHPIVNDWLVIESANSDDGILAVGILDGLIIRQFHKLRQFTDLHSYLLLRS